MRGERAGQRVAHAPVPAGRTALDLGARVLDNRAPFPRPFIRAAATVPSPHDKFQAGIPMQYIYTMNGVSKIVPPKREIIKDISLSLLPRAPRSACWA